MDKNLGKQAKCPINKNLRALRLVSVATGKRCEQRPEPARIIVRARPRPQGLRTQRAQLGSEGRAFVRVVLKLGRSKF
jgi:hypothetical protein